AFFGPLVAYGLTSIALRQASRQSARSLPVARLRVPGRVVLYEQPVPPWTIPQLAPASIERLRLAGATVTPYVAHVRVDWSPDALRGFLLFDGLMHEIGHHLIQQHTGKRTARV